MIYSYQNAREDAELVDVDAAVEELQTRLSKVLRNKALCGPFVRLFIQRDELKGFRYVAPESLEIIEQALEGFREAGWMATYDRVEQKYCFQKAL